MTSRVSRTLLAAAALVAGAVLSTPAAAQVAYASRANGGMCMDVPGGSMADGTALILYGCNGGQNQQFELQGDGHLVAMAGRRDGRGYQMCVDYYPTAGNNGDPLRLFPCHPINGSDSQRWTRLASGEFRSNSGRCIDIQGGASNAGRHGNPLVLWDCPDPANANTRRWDGRGVQQAGAPAPAPAAFPTPGSDAQLRQRISAGNAELFRRLQLIDQAVASGQPTNEHGGHMVAHVIDVIKPAYQQRAAAYLAIAQQGGAHAAEATRRANILKNAEKVTEMLASIAKTTMVGPTDTSNPRVGKPVPPERVAAVRQLVSQVTQQLRQQEQLQASIQ